MNGPSSGCTRKRPGPDEAAGCESRDVHPTHKARTLASGNVGRGSGLVGVCGPGQGIRVDLRIKEHLEGPVVLDPQLVVLVDEDLGEERLEPHWV